MRDACGTELIFSPAACKSGMAKFEDLPDNVRALILAKLAAELAVHKSANLYELAKLQRTEMMHAWRDICRKAGQPVCTIPAEAMERD